ncbi:hypothetical protein J3A84_04780 [Proteiniclasticum sp. SCR006]|uniref:Uncharacterized protein n=1 Tax=Proteiniclasticum aestuarii TaxID=2817862 RepID=A0A939H9T8_9CLOT|nr:hypothetical protein [Proteiniclasticum aestuarii]MBO1264355.1 hypothetical protein [Proteiniclasticum aestuarii]
MKPEEVIRALEVLRDIDINYPPTQQDEADVEGTIELAIQALEKQIEKKVKNIRFSRDYELAEHNIMEGECPDCGETVTGSYLGNYCGSCGVALNWEWK